MSDVSDKDETDQKAPSRSLKVKKYLASKTASSIAGKKVIMHFLGPEGSDMLSALESAAAKDVGEKQAKEFIGGILKLSFKGAVLHDEKQISTEERNRLVEPVNSLVIAVFQNLRTDIENRVDVTNMSLKFAQLEQMIVELLRKHIKQKNVDIAVGVFRYFGSVAFLEKFFNVPAFRPERTLFARNLSVIMKSRLSEENQSMPRCLFKGCKLDSLAADDVGVFGGSMYCMGHHKEQIDALLKEPYVDHFLLENGKSYQPVQDILQHHFPEHLCHFLVATYNYANSRDSIRAIFADEICEKYLAANARCRVAAVSAEAIHEIHQRLEEVRRVRSMPGAEVFSRARAEALAEAQGAFKHHVLSSEPFRKYLRTRTIPNDFVCPPSSLPDSQPQHEPGKRKSQFSK